MPPPHPPPSLASPAPLLSRLLPCPPPHPPPSLASPAPLLSRLLPCPPPTPHRHSPPPPPFLAGCCHAPPPTPHRHSPPPPPFLAGCCHAPPHPYPSYHQNPPHKHTILFSLFKPVSAAVERSGKTVALGIKAPFVGFSLLLTTLKVGDPRRSVKGSNRGGAVRT